VVEGEEEVVEGGIGWRWYGLGIGWFEEGGGVDDGRIRGCSGLRMVGFEDVVG
jgi:hypothetical protein